MLFMSACAMVWPCQEELEWSGCLLGNVVFLLMYDGVSALYLPCQTVVEVQSVAGIFTVHFLLYATQNLTLEPGTASSPSWAIIICLATAVLFTGHHGGGQQLFSVSLDLSFAHCRLLMTSVF